MTSLPSMSMLTCVLWFQQVNNSTIAANCDSQLKRSSILMHTCYTHAFMYRTSAYEISPKLRILALRV